MSKVINAYRSQLAKLKAMPFEMGLPEKIEQVRTHIEALEKKAKADELASRWDGDLKTYDPPPTEVEHIDL